MLLEFDARHEARAAQDRQHARQLLAEARQQDTRDQRASEAADAAMYRDEVRAQAKSSGQVAPQLIDFIDGSTRGEIDRTAALAKVKTAEIVAEISGKQGELAIQRDPDTGRFLPQQPVDQIVIDKSLTMQDYVERVRPQFIKQTDRGLFQ